jgi:thymidine phosphorylase
MWGSPAELIRRKRDGAALTDAEIAGVVAGIVDGSMSAAQVAALAMAVYFRGMTRDECVAMTRAMTRSGAVLDWSGENLPGPILDKHSTGGIGDKVSLVLAPLVAACGGFVPMVSGRGLGHTGGTLDKLESIPGYDATPDLGRFRSAVRSAGCAIVGQTAELAPADRRLYAIRDVTATADSIPLITASILSKKLAAGLDALVMDVKVGSGALVPGLDGATALAESLVTVAAGVGLRTVALLTDMDQVLGDHVGNALEVGEAIDFLTGKQREPRLHTVTTALARELLVLGGVVRDDGEAARAVDGALASGAATERFARMVAALGGPRDLVEHPVRHLRVAPVRRPVSTDRPGVITRVDARAIGLVLVGLGGAWRRAEDGIDPAVGLTDVQGPGDAVGPDQPIAIVHARSVAEADGAAAAIRAAVVVGEGPPPKPVSPVLRRIDASG